MDIRFPIPLTLGTLVGVIGNVLFVAALSASASIDSSDTVTGS